MADSKHRAGHGLVNPHVHHEPDDVNVVAVTKFGIALALMIVLTLFLLWGLFNYFKHQEAAASPPGPPGPAAQLPPEPRLEKTPVLDLRELREAEDQALDRYAWVDPNKGVVRIPVERAIDILAQRGLPSRPEQK
jgi:hypothetical protein